jgi:3-phosphoshikimate 1-carboxyvinyltransferase
MKRLRLIPLAAPVRRTVTVPGSKSYTIRALLIAAMAPGNVRITNPLAADDTDAMIACLKKLGVKVTRNATFIEVGGHIDDIAARDYTLNAGLSGISLRFMLALCCLLPGRQTLRGEPGLNARPVGDMVKSLRGLGADIEYLGKDGYPPLRVNSSGFTAGTARISGAESSQYLSGLLMVAPLAGLNIEVTGELVSRPYVDMTLGIMEDFGVKAKALGNVYKIRQQAYNPGVYTVEGDVSAGCYFFAAAALTGSAITVKGIGSRSRQADMRFLDILEKMGSRVTYGAGEVTVTGKELRPVEVNMRDCPDQAQTLAVLAAFADGKTVISGIQSLRVKETERIKALEQELAKMGIKTSSAPSSLTIRGGAPHPATIDTYGDHRMAMSFAVAGAKLAGIQISEPGVVSKTFPDFWKKLEEIGVKADQAQPNIVLIGMRGSGKTTVARRLARQLGIEALDLDEIMAQRLELSTPEIVEKYGWQYFRDQESTIAKEVSATDNKLISTGGGVVLKPQNVAALKKNGIIVLLRASADVLVRRLGKSTGRPPLTNAPSLEDEVRQVLHERQDLYEAAADVIIDTDKMSAKEVVDAIITRTGRAS